MPFHPSAFTATVSITGASSNGVWAILTSSNAKSPVTASARASTGNTAAPFSFTNSSTKAASLAPPSVTKITAPSDLPAPPLRSALTDRSNSPPVPSKTASSTAATPRSRSPASTSLTLKSSSNFAIQGCENANAFFTSSDTAIPFSTEGTLIRIDPSTAITTSFALFLAASSTRSGSQIITASKIHSTALHSAAHFILPHIPAP